MMVENGVYILKGISLMYLLLLSRDIVHNKPPDSLDLYYYLIDPLKRSFAPLLYASTESSIHNESISVSIVDHRPLPLPLPLAAARLLTWTSWNHGSLDSRASSSSCSVSAVLGARSAWLKCEESTLSAAPDISYSGYSCLAMFARGRVRACCCGETSKGARWIWTVGIGT